MKNLNFRSQPYNVSIIMNSKRVLIVNTGTLLMAGIESLVESNLGREYEVLSIKVFNPDDLIHEIARYEPTVVVIEDTTSFITPAALLALLQNTRLIVLNNRASKAEIYDKSETRVYSQFELTISHPDRLIDALNHGAARYR